MYLRYHDHYVMGILYSFYNVLKSVTFVCFSKMLTCSDPNGIFCLTAIGSSSNNCLVLLVLPGLLKACHVHAWFGDQRLGQSLYTEFWSSLSVAFFPGLHLHFPVAMVAPKSVLVLQARKTADFSIGVLLAWHRLGPALMLETLKTTLLHNPSSFLPNSISSQDLACFWLLSSVFR